MADTALPCDRLGGRGSWWAPWTPGIPTLTRQSRAGMAPRNSRTTGFSSGVLCREAAWPRGYVHGPEVTLTELRSKFCPAPVPGPSEVPRPRAPVPSSVTEFEDRA